MISKAKLFDCLTAVLGVNLISWGIWEEWLKYYSNAAVLALVGGAALLVLGIVKYSHWNWKMLNENVIDELELERKSQDVAWGGEEHDDHQHSVYWLEKIEDHYHRGMEEVLTQDKHERRRQVRLRLKKIAAVAVAGMQSIDRRNSKGM